MIQSAFANLFSCYSVNPLKSANWQMVLQYYAFYLYYVRKALLKLCEDASPPVTQSAPSHFLNHIVTTSQHQARTFAPVNK